MTKNKGMNIHLVREGFSEGVTLKDLKAER